LLDDLNRDDYYESIGMKLKSWGYITSPEFTIKLDYLYVKNNEYKFLSDKDTLETKRIIVWLIENLLKAVNEYNKLNNSFEIHYKLIQVR